MQLRVYVSTAGQQQVYCKASKITRWGMAEFEPSFLEFPPIGSIAVKPPF